MVLGTLEVLLVSAKGLENMDTFAKMDPYVVLTCTSQEKKSTVKAGFGSNPEWHETFVFSISGSGGTPELRLRIMDKDAYVEDDFVGQVTIPLEDVMCHGRVPPKFYHVVKNDKTYGEIKVGLSFMHERH